MSSSKPVATQAQLDNLVDAILKIVSDSQKRRSNLKRAGAITDIYYPLQDQASVTSYVNTAVGGSGLSNTDQKSIVKGLGVLLKRSPNNPPTVNWLENELLTYAAQLNLTLLGTIIAGISKYQGTIDQSTTDLGRAVNRIKNMDEGFAAIALFVNLVEAMIKVSAGDFNALAKVIANLP